MQMFLSMQWTQTLHNYISLAPLGYHRMPEGRIHPDQELGDVGATREAVVSARHLPLTTRHGFIGHAQNARAVAAHESSHAPRQDMSGRLCHPRASLDKTYRNTVRL